jgi:hypothetical protein
MERSVFFISDRTGITVETLGHSLLTQFAGVRFDKHTLRFVDTPDKARSVAAAINQKARDDGQRPVVFATLIDDGIRRLIAASDCLFLDLVNTFIAPLEAELGTPSSHTVGQAHGLVNAGGYNRRMDAINFSQTSDDGQGTRGYASADVIILGVSRSGKTPTCLYLALTFGIYAANYPLTQEDLDDPRLPPALAPYSERLFGLQIDPARLHQIRQERQPDSQYASLRQCQLEVRQADALFRNNAIPTLATTSMSVEEIATTILARMNLSVRRT